MLNQYDNDGPWELGQKSRDYTFIDSRYLGMLEAYYCMSVT